ncbi:hypothetical protein MSM1_17945 [Mycobacterium sp. SM1]|uniref:hypothetical protein n=1 Tax=Mycobacterium sp. SM1 TaxID=2816243 RepID=UPI001BCC4E63|nr:hypothetical protein [Mycobacterium sp. SM1]MBS4730131.1 hypothetical protein [Mycobacterium sp. SM1]
MAESINNTPTVNNDCQTLVVAESDSRHSDLRRVRVIWIPIKMRAALGDSWALTQAV